MFIAKNSDSSKIDGLKLKTSNLADLSYLITVAATGNLDKAMLSEWIDQRLLTTQISKSDKEELDLIHTGIRELYDVLLELIAAKKWQAHLQQGKAIDMQQPKFKVSVAADILKVERATLNNWTNSKGDYIRSFDYEGYSKFILLQDLEEKYKQLTGNELVLDKDYLDKYQYRIKI